MSIIPSHVKEVYLKFWGYDDCIGYMLKGKTKYEFSQPLSSELADNHPDEYIESMEYLRECLIKDFEEYGLDISEVKNFDKSIFDWEYRKCLV